MRRRRSGVILFLVIGALVAARMCRFRAHAEELPHRDGVQCVERAH